MSDLEFKKKKKKKSFCLMHVHTVSPSVARMEDVYIHSTRLCVSFLPDLPFVVHTLYLVR